MPAIDKRLWELWQREVALQEKVFFIATNCLLCYLLLVLSAVPRGVAVWDAVN